MFLCSSFSSTCNLLSPFLYLPPILFHYSLTSFCHFFPFLRFFPLPYPFSSVISSHALLILCYLFPLLPPSPFLHSSFPPHYPALPIIHIHHLFSFLSFGYILFHAFLPPPLWVLGASAWWSEREWPWQWHIWVGWPLFSSLLPSLPMPFSPYSLPPPHIHFTLSHHPIASTLSPRFPSPPFRFLSPLFSSSPP